MRGIGSFYDKASRTHRRDCDAERLGLGYSVSLTNARRIVVATLKTLAWWFGSNTKAMRWPGWNPPAGPGSTASTR